MLFSEAITDYLNYLAHELRHSPRTVSGYKSWLRRFEKWLGTNGYPQPASLEPFTTVVLRRYLHELSAERKLRPRTIRSAFHPLRGLGLYLVENRVLERSPAHELKLPTKDAADRSIVSGEELTALLAATERQRDKVKVAYERALLSTLIYCGIRAQELVDMKLPHVRFDTKTLLIPHGKGDKSRLLHPPKEFFQAMQDWFAVRPAAKHDWVWSCDVRRRTSTETMRRDLEEIKARANLSNATWIKPHAIRHAFATRMMENGASLISIQASLGHSEPQTTTNYLHLSEQGARDMQSAASLKMPPPSSPTPTPPETPKPSRAETMSRMRRRSTGGTK